jgi:putative DNA primase/helicase
MTEEKPPSEFVDAALKNGEDRKEVDRLSKLTLMDFERERQEAAKRLGLRKPVLDKVVAAARPAKDAVQGQGRTLEFPEPEPWPEAVKGSALIDEIMEGVGRYVVLPADAALAVALWVLHAHCFDSFSCTPRLAITAPEKRCGKTTLLDVIKPLVPRALQTANVTAAATFRAIETLKPTLLIDEADTFFGANEELRGILNSGHRAGGQVIRTVGDNHEPRLFKTHCPVAIAQIGKLPDTLADRSIHVQLKRRGPGERVMRLRIGKTPELDELARRAARWIADNAEAIRACEPRIPDAIYNRAADNWEPLLAIAEVIGGSVPERARQLALGACGVEEPSRGTMLLADISEAFAEAGLDRMKSADLVTALIGMADRPWGECNNGRAITQNWLAKRLEPFEIGPKTVRVRSKTPRGYNLEMFSEAFERYLSPDTHLQTATWRAPVLKSRPASSPKSRPNSAPLRLKPPVRWHCGRSVVKAIGRFRILPV